MQKSFSSRNLLFCFSFLNRIPQKSSFCKSLLKILCSAKKVLKKSKKLLTSIFFCAILTLAADEARLAGVAQWQSSWFVISRLGVRLPSPAPEYGRIPEWPKGTDCKSAGIAFGGSNPPSPTKKKALLTKCFFQRNLPYGQVKYFFEMWNTPAACEIFAMRMWANFISHRPTGDISQFTKWIISHSAYAEYFTWISNEFMTWSW